MSNRQYIETLELMIEDAEDQVNINDHGKKVNSGSISDYSHANEILGAEIKALTAAIELMEEKDMIDNDTNRA